MENATVECKQGEISKEFVRLNDGKEQLHDRIGILFDKLQDIMRKPAPTTPASDVPKEMLSSQFAIDLSSVSATVETDIEKVNEIIERLEL